MSDEYDPLKDEEEEEAESEPLDSADTESKKGEWKKIDQDEVKIRKFFLARKGEFFPVRVIARETEIEKWTAGGIVHRMHDSGEVSMRGKRSGAKYGIITSIEAHEVREGVEKRKYTKRKIEKEADGGITDAVDNAVREGYSIRQMEEEFEGIINHYKKLKEQL